MNIILPLRIIKQILSNSKFKILRDDSTMKSEISRYYRARLALESVHSKYAVT